MSTHDGERTLSLEEALNEAREHFQHGRYPEAEQLYRAILAPCPTHPEANYGLGSMALHLNKPAVALPLLNAAVESAPAERRYRELFAEALLAAGRPDDALRVAESTGSAEWMDSSAIRRRAAQSRAEIDDLLQSFHSRPAEQAVESARRFTERWPGAPLGWSILGACQRSLGESDAALRSAAHTVTLNPTDAGAQSNLGIGLMEAGRLDEAENCFVQSLRINPDHAEGHNNLGIVLRKLNRLEEAEAAYRRALEIKPDYTAALGNLANCLSDRHRYEEAEQCYRSLLDLEPLRAESHINLADSLRRQGHHQEAERRYLKALEIAPDSAVAHNHLGISLRQRNRLEEATTAYRRALEIDPDYAEAYNNLANAMVDQGKVDEAVPLYRRALEIRPDYLQAQGSLTGTLIEGNRLDEAEASARRALEIDPEYAIAHHHLGVTLLKRTRLDEAVSAFLRAIEIDADLAGAHNNLGVALLGEHRWREAERSFRRALEINPEYADAHNNLGISLWDQGNGQEAAAACRKALEIDPEYTDAFSNLLFYLESGNDATPDERYAEARRFGAMAARLARPFSAWKVTPETERRLRVGFVSGDLRNHPVGHFLETVLSELSAKSLELNAYPTRPCNDQLSSRIRPLFAQWVDIQGLSDQAAARRIHDDAVDILIDLSGHTASNRLPLFAWKAAPVQLSWLGYTATTGVAEIDYYLTDPVRVPPSHEGRYTETVWHLPDTRVCFTPPKTRLPVSPLPALAHGHVTFGCFQNMSKVGDRVLRAWSRILRAVPAARLRIQNKQMADAAVRQRFATRLRAHGIDPERVIMHPPTAREAYLHAHQEVDLILDTFPYPGGTTTCEALWMGVPTLTLAGENETSRNGASQMSCAGLAEWVAANEEEYVDKAVDFAGDLARLAALRSGLRQLVADSPLVDARRFADHFELALREMWRRWCLQP